MGSAYFSLGQKLDALKAWEKAYAFNPDNKTLLKFIDKLKKELQIQPDGSVGPAKTPEAPK
jgi:tetratricopeptide (TPR) repeat protein